MYVRHELLHYRLSRRKLIECVIKIQEGNLKINIHVIDITSWYRVFKFIQDTKYYQSTGI